MYNGHCDYVNGFNNYVISHRKPKVNLRQKRGIIYEQTNQNRTAKAF